MQQLVFLPCKFDPEHNAAALNDTSMAIKAPRPIGILPLFRRLAGGIAMSATRDDMAAFFDIHGFQRGISRDGCNSLPELLGLSLQ